MKTCECKDTMIKWQIRNKIPYIFFGTVPKSNRQIIEKEEKSTPVAYIYIWMLTFLSWDRDFNR
jgi:hypothetical protein